MKTYITGIACLIILLASQLMTGCKDDTVSNNQTSETVILFTQARGVVSSDTIMTTQTGFSINAYVENTGGLKKIEFLASFNGGPFEVPENCEDCISAIGGFNGTVNYYSSTANQPGKETYRVRATDSKDKVTERSVTITTIPKPKNILRIAVGELYNQYETEKVWCSVYGTGGIREEGVTYWLKEITQPKEKEIDYLYVKSDTKGDIFCAPASSYGSLFDASTTYSAYSPSKWQDRNKTLFRKTNIDLEDFKKAKNSELLLHQLAMDENDLKTEVTDMKVGDVIFINPVSEGGRPRLFGITNIGSNFLDGEYFLEL
jgi:hypothetical protein